MVRIIIALPKINLLIVVCFIDGNGNGNVQQILINSIHKTELNELNICDIGFLNSSCQIIVHTEHQHITTLILASVCL